MENDFIPAPLGRRILAFLVDAVLASIAVNIILFIAAIVALIAGIRISTMEGVQQLLASMGSQQLLLLLAAVIAFFLLAATLWHAYFIYFEHRRNYTPGKKLMGLRVVSLSSETLTFKQAVGREVFRSYVDLPFLLLPGLISILVSKRNQRIGDFATNTLVIYSERFDVEELYLYLTVDQYQARKNHYQVATVELKEAHEFLASLMPQLFAPTPLTEKQSELVARVLPVPEAFQFDSDETRLRFLGEHLLQTGAAHD